MTEKSPVDVRQAVKTIKNAILQSQYRAAKEVNREQLSLYFGIGRYVSEHTGKGFWGTGAIDRISEQLQKELPGLRGFSSASIKKMRIFFEKWSNYVNRSPLANVLNVSKKSSGNIENLNSGKIDYTELLRVDCLSQAN